MLSKIQRTELSQARGLAKWFSVKVEIRVFGKLIWSYVWPPFSTNDGRNDYVYDE